MSILWLRRKTKIILYVTVGSFLAFIFGMWGAQLSMTKGSDRDSAKAAIAKVHGIPISPTAFANAYDNTVYQYRQYFKGAIDETMLKNIRQQTLDQLVNSVLLRKEIEAMGLKASDDEVKSYLRARLAGDGQQIDPQYLEQIKKNPEFAISLESGAREDITNQKIDQWIGEGIKVSPLEVKSRYQIENEKVTIKGVSLMADTFGKDYEPDEEKIKSTYESQKKQFEKPLRRNVSFVVVDHKSFLDQVEVSESDIGDYYDENREDFWKEEVIKGKMILTRAEENQEAEAKAKADQALSRIKAGESFVDVAEELSDWKMPGADIGELTRERAEGAFGAELTDQLFALAPGSMSEVLRAEMGYLIMLVEEHKSAGYDPVEAVRDPIIESVKKEKAMAKAMERTQALQAAAKEKGWNEAMTAEGVEVKDTGFITETDDSTDLLGFGEAQKNAFAMKVGDISNPEKGPESVLLFKVLEERAKGLAPLEEVMDEVKDMVRREEGKARALDKAKQIKERLAAGQAWEEALKDSQGIEIQESQPFSLYVAYGDFNIPTFPGAGMELAKKAFSMKEGEFSDPVEGKTGCYLFELIKREPPDWQKFDAGQEKQKLVVEKQKEFFQSWVKALRAKAEKEGKLEILMDVSQEI
jgi:peptidyl-prolyl cis-trans isomerase D